MNTSEQLTPQAPGYGVARLRELTDAANVCREIVMKTVKRIGNRDYVQVEGWTSIAVVLGLIATIKPDSVQELVRDGKVVGVRAVAQLKRQNDNVVLAEAEGYVGDDEQEWFGSNGKEVERYDQVKKQRYTKVISPRPMYAIRSMAQTRAVGKVCRIAASHVVLLINENLSTTPYEEVNDPTRQEEGDWRPSDGKTPEGAKKVEGTATTAQPSAEKREETKTAATGTAGEKQEPEIPRDEVTKMIPQFEERRWEKVVVHFGKHRGKALAQLGNKTLGWFAYAWEYGSGEYAVKEDDTILRAAAIAACNELGIAAE